MKLSDYKDAPLMVAHLIERITLISSGLSDSEIVEKAVNLAELTLKRIYSDF